MKATKGESVLSDFHFKGTVPHWELGWQDLGAAFHIASAPPPPPKQQGEVTVAAF